MFDNDFDENLKSSIKISKFWLNILENSSFFAKKVILTILLNLEDYENIKGVAVLPSSKMLTQLNIRREGYLGHLNELEKLGLTARLLNCKQKPLEDNQDVKHVRFYWSTKVCEQFEKSPNKKLYFQVSSSFVVDSIKLMKEFKINQKSYNSFFSLLFTFEVWDMPTFEINIKKLAKVAQLNRLIREEQKSKIKERLFQWLEKIKNAEIIVHWEYDEKAEKFLIKNKPKLPSYLPREGYLYVIASEHLVKLGFSANVEQRIKALERRDKEFKLLFKTKGSICTEKLYHRHLQNTGESYEKEFYPIKRLQEILDLLNKNLHTNLI